MVKHPVVPLQTAISHIVLKAYERAIFNVLFNNRDDHSKNFAFRLDRERRWRLAPAYDLTFNVGPGGEHQMALCLGSACKINQSAGTPSGQ